VITATESGSASRHRVVGSLSLIVLAVLFTFSPAHGQTRAVAPNPIEGKWCGVVGFPQDREDICFEFKRNEQGEIFGSVYQPVANYYDTKLGKLKIDGDRYEISGVNLSLTMHSGELEGHYLYLQMPLSLKPADKLPVEKAVPEFPKGPGPIWQVKLGSAIYAPAVVRDGTTYVGTTGGVFHAISLKDGSFVWTFSAGRPMHGEPLATETAVFFVCDNGFLFKLDRKTGKEIWRYDLGDARVSRILPHPTVFEFDYKAPMPVLADGVVYVGSGDGSFHAVNAESGDRVWRFATPGKIRMDAVIDGPRVIFSSFDNSVYAIDRQTGHQVWKRDTRRPSDGSPALIDGKVIIGNHGSILDAINPVNGEFVWRVPFWGSAVASTAVPYGGLFYIGASDLRRVTCFDPKDGRVVWRTDVYGWEWGRPAVTGDFIYVGVGGVNPYPIRHLGSMTALDRKTGKISWRWPMPELPGVLVYGFASAPVIEGHMLVIGGVDGTLYAFPAQ